MAIQDFLHSGSFKGATFFCDAAITVGGRKQVKHEYPNSGKQLIEDLGFKPRNFKFSAKIKGSLGDGSYFQNRDRLLAALEEGGNGMLSHPFFSSSIQVTARDYVLNERMAHLGYAEIDLEFDYNDEKANPSPIQNSLPVINKLKNNLLGGLEGNFKKLFNAVLPANFDSAKGLVGDFTSAVSVVTDTYAQIQTEIAPFKQLINDIDNNINALIVQPNNLADSIFGVIRGAENLYNDADVAFEAFTGMFDFRDDYIYEDETTESRIQRNINSKSIIYSVQTGFLAIAYVAASEVEYKTVDEINLAQQVLEDQFVKLSNSESVDDGDIYLLGLLRAQTTAFLEAEKLNASVIIPININGLYPLSLIAYQYYADESPEVYFERLQAMIELSAPISNNINFVTGSIDVVSV